MEGESRCRIGARESRDRWHEGKTGGAVSGRLPEVLEEESGEREREREEGKARRRMSRKGIAGDLDIAYHNCAGVIPVLASVSSFLPGLDTFGTFSSRDVMIAQAVHER